MWDSTDLHVKELFASPVKNPSNTLSLKTKMEANASLPKIKSLTRSEIDGVEKFVLFIGHRHSGHSIIGSMMDAHPNMIISHEFQVLKENAHMSKIHLFDELYASSQKSVISGWRSGSLEFHTKGYSLDLPSQWQGHFTELKVIGDKAGGGLTDTIGGNVTRSKKALLDLQSMLNIPIMFIQVVRNPFDTIATTSLVKNYTYIGKHRWDYLHKTVNNQQLYNVSSKRVHNKILYFFEESSTIWKVRQEWNLTLLEIHHADFIQDPVAILKRICIFLQVDCPADYLESCRDKTFSSISKSRHLIDWPPDMISEVYKKMKVYPFYKRYSFEGD